MSAVWWTLCVRLVMIAVVGWVAWLVDGAGDQTGTTRQNDFFLVHSDI
jgi:hypothetical protein